MIRSLAINRKLQFFAGRSRFGYRLSLLASVCLFLASPAAPGSITIPELPKDRKIDKKETVLPPQPVPLSVEVLEGGTVQISLRVYGKQEQTTRFLIRKEPTLGKIVSMQPAGQEVWTLTYQHATPLNGEPRAQDRILFAAQNEKGTSSPAEILLQISEPPPRLEGPAPVAFGEIAAGLPSVRTLTITNAGGGVLEGTVSVEEPWSVTPATYRLGRGERLTLRVGITPSEAREYKGRLHFSSQPEAQAPLHARASAPFLVQPASLELTGTAARSGTLKLTNRTGAELRVGITGPNRLGLPATIVLPPRATVPLPATLAATDPAPMDETLRLGLGTIVRTVTVRAPAALPTPPPSPTPSPTPARPSPTPEPSAPPLSTATPTPAAALFTPPSPSDLPATGPEPLDTDEPLPPIQNVSVVRATSKGNTVFAWNAFAAPAGTPRYQVEIRRVALDPAGKLEQRWIPIPNTRISESGGAVTASFDGVPAGVREYARVTAFGSSNQPIARSHPFPFATPVPAPLLTGRRVFLGLLFLVLAAALAAKIAQKRSIA